jgi:hypothetical protein
MNSGEHIDDPLRHGWGGSTKIRRRALTAYEADLTELDIHAYSSVKFGDGSLSHLPPHEQHFFQNLFNIEG